MQDFYVEKNMTKFEDNEIVYQTCDYPVLLTSSHCHDVIEIIYVLEGEFVVIISDVKYTLKPGEMVIVNAKEIHSVIVPDYGLHRSVTIKFFPETICSDNQSLSELKYGIPYIISFSNFKAYYSIKDLEDSDIKNYIDAIMREDRGREPAYKFAIRIYISAIVLELYRKFNAMNPMPEDIRDDIRVKFINIFQFVSEHYFEKLTANEISKMFNLRPSVFSNYLKKITGKSFNEYLNYTRICKAKRMLVDSEKNIEEISYDVGFSSPSYFIKCFKSQMGTTPMGFRQEYSDPSAKMYVLISSNL